MEDGLDVSGIFKTRVLPNKEMTVYAISTILVLKHEYSVTEGPVRWLLMTMALSVTKTSVTN